MAVPLAISTRRLVRPYQRLTRWRCQETLGSLRTAESFFKRLPLIGGRPRRLRFCGGKADKLGSNRNRGGTHTKLCTAARDSIVGDPPAATPHKGPPGGHRWGCPGASPAASVRELVCR